jgi:hypothetical protein
VLRIAVTAACTVPAHMLRSMSCGSFMSSKATFGLFL